MIRSVIVFLLAGAFHAKVFAGPVADTREARKQGAEIIVVTPIFSQLLATHFPKGFVPVYEATKDGRYMHESVRQGESVDTWSEMITITGAKDFVSKSGGTPAAFAGAIAAGFKRACPDTFSGTGLGEIQLGRYKAYAAVVSCGMLQTAAGNEYSESALLIVVEGDRDYYTVQWAERREASKTPIEFDRGKWSERANTLLPIKLCSIVPGEAFPYPSCTSE